MCRSTSLETKDNVPLAALQRFNELLAARKLRLTPQRRAVFGAILACRGHICAEHVLAAVARQRPELRINKTTVYRNLDLLVELGLVIEHKCGEGSAQYEPAFRGQHSHLLCRRCGAMFDLDNAIASGLRTVLRAQLGFYAEIERHPILGLCADCHI